MFGSMLVQYAILWYITLNARSGVMLTAMIIVGFLPTFVLSPFAGVWADRYDRKKLIIISDALTALTTLGLAVVFMFGFEGYWPLLLASFLRAIGQGIQGPAIGAIIPQFVPQEKLTRVNGIYGTIQSASMLVAPMVAGALMTFAPLQTIFYIDVVTAAIAIAIFLFFIKVPTHAKALMEQKLSYFQDMLEGIRYVGSHGYLKRFFLFVASFLLLAAPMAFLTPLQVVRSFGEEVWRLTAIEIGFSVGMMLGGAIITAWGGFKNRLHTIVLSTITVGVFSLGLGVVPVFWLYVLMMGLIGLSFALYHAPANVLLQENVEESFLGRVYGVMTMISSSMMPIGMLIFGPIGDRVAVETLLVFSGIIITLIGLILPFSKVLLAAGSPREVPEEEPALEPEMAVPED